MSYHAIDESFTGNESAKVNRQVALYRQKRKYTCGPSSLMMAMSALDPLVTPNEVLELEIWREATTIHGGCGPVGLALALDRRNFAARVVMNHGDTFLATRASTLQEEEAMRILQSRDIEEARRRDIDIEVRDYTLDDLFNWMSEGWHPITMIGIEFEGKSVTHWVVVVGFSQDGLLINDPLIEPSATVSETIIPFDKFNQISAFGAHRERAVVLAGLKQWRSGRHPLTNQ